MANNICIIPTIQEVENLCKSKGYLIDPQKFFNEREARGWISKKGKPIKDWKGSLRNAEYRIRMACGLRGFKPVRF